VGGGEAHVRSYASPENAFTDARKLDSEGKKIRVIYAQDYNSGIKLFAQQAWFARDAKGQLAAFLGKDSAATWAKANNGTVVDYAAARQSAKLASN
jgi:NitT/TauT family transport system substrate-binding protein